MRIRNAGPDDTPGIREAHTASIRELCAQSYEKSLIEAWIAALTPEAYAGGLATFDALVAEENGRILAWCLFDAAGGEIKALYAAPWAAGCGAGSALLRLAEERAAQCGASRISLFSTLNAAGFYERRGYVSSGPAEHALPSGGRLACLAMEKTLSG